MWQVEKFVHPTVVLFNGGVFKAATLKERVMEVLNNWLAADGGQSARELEGVELDLAVARGAAYYGWVRRGHGLRIRGGTARAYYVGVETSMPAVPGFEPPVKALCVAPFGMEEGTQADIPPQEFGLVVGEPPPGSVSFPAHCAVRTGWASCLTTWRGTKNWRKLRPLKPPCPPGTAMRESSCR